MECLPLGSWRLFREGILGGWPAEQKIRGFWGAGGRGQASISSARDTVGDVVDVPNVCVTCSSSPSPPHSQMSSPAPTPASSACRARAIPTGTGQKGSGYR